MRLGVTGWPSNMYSKPNSVSTCWVSAAIRSATNSGSEPGWLAAV